MSKGGLGDALERTLLSPHFNPAYSPSPDGGPKSKPGVWKNAAVSIISTRAADSTCNNKGPAPGCYSPLTNGSASPSMVTLDHMSYTPLSHSPQRSPNLSPSPSHLEKSASDCSILSTAARKNAGRDFIGGGGVGRPSVGQRESCSPSSRRKNSKCMNVLYGLRNGLAAVMLLYIFVCSLSLMGSGLKLMAGKTAGSVFTQDSLLANPVAGLMVGVLATVLVQSSSTSTSIVVTMVASNILPVPTAIPIIMGANIGTSVTNTIVAMSQVQITEEFRRAFAGATVHDMFNWLTVIILLPLEVVTHYLQWLSGLLVSNLELSNSANAEIVGLELLTKMVTKRIVIVDKSVITNMAMANAASLSFSSFSTNATSDTLEGRSNDNISEGSSQKGGQPSRILKPCGHSESVANSYWVSPGGGSYSGGADVSANSSSGAVALDSSSGWTSQPAASQTVDESAGLEKCTALFNWIGLSDWASGMILFFISFLLLCICLILLVKVLKGIFSGPMSDLIKRTVNDDFPGRFACLTGYVAIIVGSIMTILVQSSSVFTSTLTPLVGLGVIELERVFPLTLGSNIGTTVTGLLAALTADASTKDVALQIAFCHLLFNVTGILIWYPVPIIRKVPLKLAELLGEITEKYRWFAVFYLVMMFFLAPVFVFALSVAGSFIFLAVTLPLLVSIFLIVVINLFQRSSRLRNVLPPFLRNWNFLPLFMHSLAPWDRCLILVWRLVRKVLCCTQKQSGGHNQRSPARTSCIENQTAL